MSPQIGAILFEILGNYYRTMQYCQQFHALWKTAMTFGISCTGVSMIIEDYRSKYLGFGAKKTSYKFRESFIGITENQTQIIINSDPDQRRVHAAFEM